MRAWGIPLLCLVLFVLFWISLLMAAMSAHAETEIGVASWYGHGFYGHRTACGQTYTGRGMTAAHKHLPCGTHVRVTSGSRSVEVVITDRGPYVRGRVIDLSGDARRALGMGGTAQVQLTIIGSAVRNRTWAGRVGRTSRRTARPQTLQAGNG